MENRKRNANVVLVMLDGKDVYSIPGQPSPRLACSPGARQERRDYASNKQGGTWVTTPLPQRSQSRLEYSAKLRLTDSGPVEGKVTALFAGLEAIDHRLRVRNAEDVTRKRLLEDHLKSLIPGSAEVTLTSPPDWSSSETPGLPS